MADVVVTTPRKKLSASAMTLFLKSPKAFYWAYIKRVQTAEQTVGSFDHDKIMGVLWSEFVDRFYKQVPEVSNTKKMLIDWDEQTQGWVSEKTRVKYRGALESWANTYYQMFDPSDGCRNGSEKLVENDRFMGYVDGLSHNLVLHEVKSTSRSPQLVGQLWKVQNSLQVKLYCVLTKATGICIEFAWKDTPYGIYRSEVIPVTPQQLIAWEQELNTLADYIYSLGDDPNNYPCHPDGCCPITKNITSLCQYQTLCEMGLDETTKVLYKEKSSREPIPQEIK